MGDLAVIALIVFLAIPVPLLIALHFVTRWKQSRGLTSADEQMLEDMWSLSQKLEERVETLERILDNDLPEWRKKL